MATTSKREVKCMVMRLTQHRITDHHRLEADEDYQLRYVGNDALQRMSSATIGKVMCVVSSKRGTVYLNGDARLDMTPWINPYAMTYVALDGTMI